MNETDVHVKEKFKQNKKNPFRTVPVRRHFSGVDSRL